MVPYVLDERLAMHFYKEPESKYFRFVGPYIILQLLNFAVAA